ncbi:flagellar biosynthetic protein FliO [Halalkalibacillus halophilus]|uniref:flagellar biosynthetic protein FliO n=1 Tax=Halalkalibacillus halophilus TaxID=392827 RepID=UPI00146C475A|nr:flagellar biosynthetic protein FliO [Halalkalibacillus halophilus]
MANNGNVSDWFEEDTEEDDQDEEESEPGTSEDESDAEEQLPAAEEDEEQAIGESNRSLFLDFVRMIIALVLVLALIYFLLKFLQKRTRIYQQSRALENIGGVSLGANKSAQMVRVGNEYFLLGVGDDVQFLSKIEDQETIDKMLESEAPQQKQQNTFQSLLQNFQNRNRNPYQDDDSKRQFKNELETMKSTRERVMKRYQDRNDRSDE